MRKEKEVAENILWRAQMHLSHGHGNGKAIDFLIKHRAELILGPSREIVPIGCCETPFTYWRNRPLASDSRPIVYKAA